MKYKTTIENQLVILDLEGDLIGEDSGFDLIGTINDAIEKGSNNGIVNIAGLRYINSSGIGVLITILTKLRNKGGELVLVSPSENVKKLLIITKLNAIFNIANSIDEAKDILNK